MGCRCECDNSLMCLLPGGRCAECTMCGGTVEPSCEDKQGQDVNEVQAPEPEPEGLYQDVGPLDLGDVGDVRDPLADFGFADKRELTILRLARILANAKLAKRSSN